MLLKIYPYNDFPTAMARTIRWSTLMHAVFEFHFLYLIEMLSSKRVFKLAKLFSIVFLSFYLIMLCLVPRKKK